MWAERRSSMKSKSMVDDVVDTHAFTEILQCRVPCRDSITKYGRIHLQLSCRPQLGSGESGSRVEERETAGWGDANHVPPKWLTGVEY
jgi:hypothetical protein